MQPDAQSPSPDGQSRSLHLDVAAAERLLSKLGLANEGNGLNNDQTGGGGSVRSPAGYTIVCSLGSGSSGRVYRAVREGSDRPVSIKIWRDGQRGERAARAWRELDMLGELTLPVVPRVLDYGSCDGSLYVVTDFIDGVDPVAFAEQHRLDLRDRARLLADIADAVQVLHEHGIIHRDLKPANILIARSASGVPHVFILDLGLAVLAQRSQEGLTLEGQPVGTLGYMAPEQARGERAKVSVRSDVYSLGAIGYRLLCGDTPHQMQETASQTLLHITTTPARAPREVAPDTPPPLSDVLGKAVRSDPGDRYASAAELATDLRRFARGERVLATPPRAWQRAMEWVANHPKAATVMVCGVIAVVSTGAVFSTLWTLRHKPSFVLFDEEHRNWAKLMSVTGEELAHWNAGTNHELIHAAFVPAKSTFLHVDCVLLVFGTHAEDGFPGEVVLMRAEDPRGTPVWRVKSADLSMPHLHNDQTGDRTAEVAAVGWTPANAFMADIYPAVAGDEVVVTNISQGLFPSCVSVIDMKGTVRFEAWNIGHVEDVKWLSKHRQLVCVGVNNTAPWKELGEAHMPETYPTVLFSLSVDREQPVDWIDPFCEDGRTLWYKAMSSTEVERLLGSRLRRFEWVPAIPSLDSTDTFVVALQRYAFRVVSRKWAFDACGHELKIPGFATAHAQTVLDEPALANAEARWIDWPDFLSLMKENHADAAISEPAAR